MNWNRSLFFTAVLGLSLLVLAGTASAAGSLADVSIYDRGSARTLPVYNSDGR